MRHAWILASVMVVAQASQGAGRFNEGDNRSDYGERNKDVYHILESTEKEALDETIKTLEKKVKALRQRSEEIDSEIAKREQERAELMEQYNTMMNKFGY